MKEKSYSVILLLVKVLCEHLGAWLCSLTSVEKEDTALV